MIPCRGPLPRALVRYASTATFQINEATYSNLIKLLSAAPSAKEGLIRATPYAELEKTHFINNPTKMALLGTTVLDHFLVQLLKQHQDHLSKNQLTVLGALLGSPLYLTTRLASLETDGLLPSLAHPSVHCSAETSKNIPQTPSVEGSNLIKTLAATCHLVSPSLASTFAASHLFQSAHIQNYLSLQSPNNTLDMPEPQSGLDFPTLELLIKHALPSKTMSALLKLKKMPVLYARYTQNTADQASLDPNSIYTTTLFSGKEELISATGPSPRGAIRLAARKLAFSDAYFAYTRQVSAPVASFDEDYDHIPVLED